MKKWKKVLARLLTAAMLCALVPVTAVHAAYEVMVEPAAVDYPEADVAGPFLETGVETVAYGDKVFLATYDSNYHHLKYYLAQYTGSEIKILDRFEGNREGFSDCGYAVVAVVRDEVYHYGIIDSSGKVVVPFGEYYSIYTPSEDGYVYVTKYDGRNYLLNLAQGTEPVEIVYPNFEEAGVYANRPSNGILLYKKFDSETFFYARPDGSHYINEDYDYASVFYKGHAVVKTVGSEVYQIIDSNGGVVADLPESVVDFRHDLNPVGDNGLIPFRDENGNYGFADLTGKIVIAPQYNRYAEYFHNGYAVVSKSYSGIGMIDTNGDVVIPFGLYLRISNATEDGLVWVVDSNNNLGVVQVTPGAAEDPGPVDPEPEKADLTLPDAVKYVPYSVEIGKLAEEIKGDGYELWEDPYLSPIPSWLSLDEKGAILSGIPTAAGEYNFTLYYNVPQGVEPSPLTVTLAVYANSDKNVKDQSDPGYEIISPKPELYLDDLHGHTFISRGEFSQFLDAYIDGHKLEKNVDYTVREGSTEVTIGAQTFNGFGAGDHTFAATFNDGGSTKTSAQNFTIGSISPGGSSSSSSNDSSDSDNTSTYFKLNIPSFDHGKVSGPSNVAYGSRTTLTVTPDDGYQLDSISVTRSNGKEIDLSKKGDKYSFYMPETEVTVHAAFSKLPEPETSTQQPDALFSDVPAGAWFAPAVEWAVQRGYMTGYGNGIFAPNDKVEAGTIAVILANIAGADLSQYENLHDPDIPDGQWYTSAAAWAKAAGMFPDGTFQNEDATLRGDMAVMLVRYLRFLGVECTAPETPVAFADAGEMTAEQNEAFQILYSMGVLSGMGNGVMGTSSTTTRAQMAALTRSIYNCVSAAKP